MSVLLNTSAGDLVIDLFTESCPIACTNFLKLCQIKYYNNCLFYNVQQNFIAQTGDPTGTGKGGNSIYGILKGDHASYFKDEVVKNQKITKVGMVGMAHSGGKEDSNRSQFFITLRGEDMDQFEKNHTIFGEIAEGLDVLEKINALYCDEDGRPYQDVRILHTYVLDDPIDDPPGLQVPPASPERTFPEQERVKRRIPYSEKIEDDADGKTAEELDLSIRRKEAKSRAIVLEMTGDIPDAEVKPPDEVLFVCKLNPVTTDEDLELIFSRFGTIKSCEVIRDFKTGDSLNYAFVEFETAAACIEAYEKMNNVLIDDRRIKVDFSQSVSKLWNRFLQQPRKDGDGKSSAPKPGEKPSYYMRQPGMGLGAAAGPPQTAVDRKPASLERPPDRAPRADAPRQQQGHSHRGDSRDRGNRHSGDVPVKREGEDRQQARSRDSRDRDAGRGRDRSRDRSRDCGKDRHGGDDKSNRDRDRDQHSRSDRPRERDRSRDGHRERERDHQDRSTKSHRDRDESGRDSARDRDGRDERRDTGREREAGKDHRRRDDSRDRKRDRSPADRDHDRSGHRSRRD
jgi:peptidyl-prolyl cis-trans isomerase-like 4